MAGVVVRAEQPSDVDAIRNLLISCFPTDGEARLVEALRLRGQLLLSLVAETEGQIVGHVAFSPVSTSGGTVGLGLAPLAVAETYRRQGIDTQLVRQSLAAASQLGLGWAVVLGDPDLYRCIGFLPASAWGLVDAYGGGEAVQVVALQPSAIPARGGLVSYGPEFALVS